MTTVRVKCQVNWVYRSCTAYCPIWNTLKWQMKSHTPKIEWKMWYIVFCLIYVVHTCKYSVHTKKYVSVLKIVKARLPQQTYYVVIHRLGRCAKFQLSNRPKPSHTYDHRYMRFCTGRRECTSPSPILAEFFPPALHTDQNSVSSPQLKTGVEI